MDDTIQSSPSMSGIEGDLGVLARAVAVQGSQLVWLIGAGASVMSGIPTAGQLTLRFKHALYCDANGLDEQDVDPSDPHTLRLISDFFATNQALPQPGENDEYAASFEKAYPSADLRADLIAEICRGTAPNYGHYLMAALMVSGYLSAVFTTNFDDLIETAAASVADGIEPRPSIVVADLGDPDKAVRAFQKSSWPLIAKIHGDFRSERLKNTPSELEEQDTAMRHILRESCGKFGLVVAGYSGRDESVMAVLRDALTDHASFPSGIFWCYRPTDTVAPGVLSLLHEAKESGRTTAAIPVDNFVEMTAAIERAVRLTAPLREVLDSKRPKPIAIETPMPTGATSNFPVVRFNALPITALPSMARVLEETKSTDLREMQRAVRASRARGLVARRSGGQLVAAGDDSQLTAALTPLGVRVTAQTVPFEWNTGDSDTADRGLALDALTLGLGRTEGLRHVLSRRAHQVRVSDAAVGSLSRLKSACHGLMGTVPRTTLPWAEAVTLNLDYRVGRWWLLLVPEVWVPRGGRQTQEGVLPQTVDERLAIADFIRERRGTRYNRDVNAILDAWVRLLCAGRNAREVRTWNLGNGAGVDPVFEIVGRTAYSRPFRAVPSVSDSA
jgi:NAD-dependent SIR2 family protein deacetylase